MVKMKTINNGKPLRSDGVLGLKGAAWLAGAALFAKLLGVLQKIPLQNLAGDQVFGLYNAVYPFYQLLAALAAAGLPAAVSILTAEQGHESEAKKNTITDENPTIQLLATAIFLMGASGIVSACLLAYFADAIAVGTGAEEAAGAFRSLALALAIVPVMGVLRGYAQGLGYMPMSAMSQVLEQTVRVAVMVVVLWRGLSYSYDEGELTAAIMNGSAAGALAALFMLLIMFKIKHNQPLDTEATTRQKSYTFSLWKKGTFGLHTKRLMSVALPAVLGAAVVPVIAVADAFTIPRLLTANGVSAQEAMIQFGVYSRGQPLVQLTAMLTGAIAGALAPKLVVLRRQSKQTALAGTALILRLLLVLSGAAAIGIFLLAEKINIALYASAEGTDVLALIGLSAFFASMLAALSPLLQAFGAMKSPAVLFVIAAVLKALFNFTWIDKEGITGAAYSGIAAQGIALAAGLALLLAVMKKDKGNVERRIATGQLISISKAVVIWVVMGAAVKGFLSTAELMMQNFEHERTSAVIITGAAVASGTLIVVGLLWLLRYVQEDEKELLGLSKVKRK